jgi:hypothetical protein
VSEEQDEEPVFPDIVKRIEGIEQDLHSWAAKPVEITFDPSGTDPFSIMELSLSYAKRCADLASSIRLLLEDNHVVAATVIARALIETIGIGCLFLSDMDRLIAAGDRDSLGASKIESARGAGTRNFPRGTITVRGTGNRSM